MSGENIAFIIITSSAGSLLAQSRIHYRSSPQVVIVPPVVHLLGGRSASADLYFVGKKIPKDLRALTKSDGVIAELVQKNPRGYTLIVTAASAQDVVTVDIADRSGVLRSITMAANRAPEGKLRVASIAQNQGSIRRTWVLHQGLSTRVHGPGGLVWGEEKDTVDPTMSWLWLDYRIEDIGSHAVVHWIEDAIEHSEALSLW